MHRIKVPYLVLAFVLAAQAGGFATARADPLALHQSGVLGPTSTLGGVSFGTDTPFSYTAVFDTASGTPVDVGAALFDITSLRIDITGYGDFTADNTADLRVFLGDLSFGGAYYAGIAEATLDTGFVPIFGDSSSPFDAASPVPTTFSNFLDPDATLPLLISLSGGAGPLVINDFGAAPFAASITAVPEPSSFVLAGLGVGCVLGHRWRRPKRAASP